MPKKKISQSVEAALNAIEVSKDSILKFHYVVGGIRRRYSSDKCFDDAVEVINSRLYQKLNDAYATLFMWGNIAPEEAQKEAKKYAFQNYLNESSAIMQYLNFRLESPGMWDSEEEKQFRKELEEAK